MSAFKAIATKFRRIDCLVDALSKVKKEWAGVLSDKKNIDPAGKIHLQGYQGDDRAVKPVTDKNYAPPCVIRIPRHSVGSASNDIGFAMGADGNLELYVSDYDKGTYGVDFVHSLTQVYGLNEGTQDAMVEGAEVDPAHNGGQMTTLGGVPGLQGKKQVGVRMRMPRSMAMQASN